jgi:hypothetical protein
MQDCDDDDIIHPLCFDDVNLFRKENKSNYCWEKLIKDSREHFTCVPVPIGSATHAGLGAFPRGPIDMPCGQLSVIITTKNFYYGRPLGFVNITHLCTKHWQMTARMPFTSLDLYRISFGALQNAPQLLTVTNLRVQNVIPVKWRQLDGEDGVHAACGEAPKEEATALALAVELETSCLSYNPAYGRQNESVISDV